MLRVEKGPVASVLGWGAGVAVKAGGKAKIALRG